MLHGEECFPHPLYSSISFSFISFPFVFGLLIPTSGLCWYEACCRRCYCWCLLVLLLFWKLHLWRTKPFSSNMNSTVCLSTGERGGGTSLPLWFTVELSPTWLWPRSKLVIVSPCSSLSLSSFSFCTLYLFLASSSLSFFFGHSFALYPLLISYATLCAPCLSSYLYVCPAFVHNVLLPLLLYFLSGFTTSHK